MASRRLEDLNEPTRALAEAFQLACLDEGIDVLIYCTLRDYKEQDELYARGRTTAGKIVTNARGGYSWHNFGSAFDFVPLIGGKPQWGDVSLYLKCGIIAERVGLEWAGRWSGKLKETAHCQFRNGLTLEQARKKWESSGTL